MHETRNDTALSRRGFFKAAALGGAGLAGAAMVGGCAAPSPSSAGAATSDDGLAATGEPSFLTAPTPIDASEITETIDTDVLVIGSGIAGAVTASSCTEHGLKVLLVEKAEAPRNIGLDYGLVNPSIMAEKDIEPVDVYEVARDHMEKSCHRCRGDKVYRFMTESGAAGDWYLEKARGYGFVPEVIAMKSNSDHFKNYVHVVELWPDEGTVTDDGDWYAATKAMIANLQQEVVDGGGEYRNLTEAVQLLTEDGRVTGAVCKGKDGYLQVNTAKGVVLAAGDYMNNESMVDRNLRDAAMFPLCLVNHTGDGHILGILAGGRMAPLGHARQIHTNYIGPFMFYPFLALDVHGKRFCNETIPMSSLNISMSATYKPEDRGIHFRIFDSKTEGAVEGIPGVPPVALVGEGSAWMDPETVVSGNTLEELCEAAGIPVADGVASIERYNELCAKGCDDDFGVAGSDMAAIDTPPFFCIKGDVGMSGINAGVMVDNRYRVIDTEGAPIPGLYAAGIQAGNPCGGINWSMPGGFSNSHIFTAGRYTVIHALTGDMTPAHPASFEDLADSFVGEDGGYAWDSPLCATAITVW